MTTTHESFADRKPDTPKLSNPESFGHVTPNDPPLEIPISEVTISKLSVGSMDNNVYLISVGQDAVLIDAATDSSRILDFFGDAPISTVVTTHRHFDHHGALAQVLEITGAQPVCGKPDAEAIRKATGVTCDEVWTSDQISLGEYSLGVIGLVGHTPGSIALVLDVPNNPVHIFTGDSLFPGGLGKTHSPQEFESLFRDVTARIFDVFADDTVIHPGHGNDTLLGWERPHLDDWKQRGW